METHFYLYLIYNFETFLEDYFIGIIFRNNHFQRLNDCF